MYSGTYCQFYESYNHVTLECEYMKKNTSLPTSEIETARHALVWRLTIVGRVCILPVTTVHLRKAVLDHQSCLVRSILSGATWNTYQKTVWRWAAHVSNDYFALSQHARGVYLTTSPHSAIMMTESLDNSNFRVWNDYLSNTKAPRIPAGKKS